jgi:hypothetical protein
MARKVFFSFHYGRDIWRVNVVRNSGLIEGFAAAGFHDASVWEEAEREGSDAIQRLIDKGLEVTSVTAVLIGAETANRRWISYEIEQSAERKHGILGVRINSIKDQYGKTDVPGPIPAALLKLGAPIYAWEYGRFGQWVEQAYKAANS